MTSPNVFSQMAFWMLLCAMGIGLIISSVLWSNQVATLNTQMNFTVISSNDSITSLTDPRVRDLTNLDPNGPVTNLLWALEVTEFPKYYRVSFNFGGALPYIAVDVSTSLKIINIIPDKFAYPVASDIINPPGTGLAMAFGGGPTVCTGLFDANAVTGLYTDLFIIFPFGPSPGSPINGVLVTPRAYTNWVVYK